MAHNIRSLYNVGALFRTADGAGVSKIYLTGYTGQPPRDQISKTALGAEETVPWEHYVDPLELIDKLKKEGVSIVALESTKDSVLYTDFKPNFPLCLIVGHEVEGVPDELLEKCDDVIHIPMRGVKESLNVTIAFGVAVYELLR